MAEEENNETEAPEESGGGLVKKLMMGGMALVLVGGGIFAGPAVMNIISPPPAEDEGEGVVEEGEEAPEESKQPALYVSLHPPLVVNIKDAVGETHFMQITMEVMARDQELLNSVREHAAVIRNNLILLYSTAIYEDVTTREGKEKLLSDGLQEIKSAMLDLVGDDGIEALYFTTLIIQ